MNDNPSSNFIKKIIGQNREVLLAIIKGLFYEIHELMLNDFFLEKKTSALFEIKKNDSINDFSGAANLFRSEYYLNKRFTPKYNPSLGVETVNKISLAKLKTSILKLKEELVREKIKGLIQNQFYNLNSIDEISRLVIDINNLRNIEEHELGNSDFSKAALLYASCYRPHQWLL